MILQSSFGEANIAWKIDFIYILHYRYDIDHRILLYGVHTAKVRLVQPTSLHFTCQYCRVTARRPNAALTPICVPVGNLGPLSLAFVDAGAIKPPLYLVFSS